MCEATNQSVVVADGERLLLSPNLLCIWKRKVAFGYRCKLFSFGKMLSPIWFISNLGSTIIPTQFSSSGLVHCTRSGPSAALVKSTQAQSITWSIHKIGSTRFQPIYNRVNPYPRPTSVPFLVALEFSGQFHSVSTGFVRFQLDPRISNNSVIVSACFVLCFSQFRVFFRPILVFFGQLHSIVSSSNGLSASLFPFLTGSVLLQSVMTVFRPILCIFSRSSIDAASSD